MKILRSVAIVSILVAPLDTAHAQSAPELRLPERLDEAFRDMMERMKPSIDEALEAMRGFSIVDDPRHYQMPELLPNGDIILRRRPDAPALEPEAPGETPATPTRPDTPVDDSVKT